MFHGVPIVGVPFMVEQASNVQRAASRGFAVVSLESVGLRREGQRFSRRGVAGLIKKVRQGRGWKGGDCQPLD